MAWWRSIRKLVRGCDCKERLLCCDPRCRIVAGYMLTYYTKVGDSVSG